MATNNPNVFKANTEKNNKNLNNTSRNMNLGVGKDESKTPSLLQIMNTSPDASMNNKLKPSLTPPSDPDYENIPMKNNININNISGFQQGKSGSSNTGSIASQRNASASPFGQRMVMEGKKANPFGFPQSPNENIMKKKIFQCNMLAQSKDEKFSNLSKLSDINVNSSNLNRQKTPNNRSLTRDISEHNLILKNKSKSIAAGLERNQNIAVSQERKLESSLGSNNSNNGSSNNVNNNINVHYTNLNCNTKFNIKTYYGK